MALVCVVIMHAAARPTVNFCYIPRYSSTNAMSAMHSAFATDYYRSNASSVDFNFRYVSKYGAGNVDVKAAMYAMLANGTNCHIWFGPGSSRLSITLSTVIETAWVDYASTSLELSDKTQHPYFSRVVPSDDFGGKAMAAIVDQFGWKKVTVLCGDEPYGRSITGAFTASLADLNGVTVETSRCLTVDATVDDFKAAIRTTIIPADSRIVMAALLSTGLDNFIQAALEMRLHDTHVIVFAESACSGDVNWLQLPGSLCATFSTEATGENVAWPAAYLAKSYHYVTDLIAAGTPLNQINVNGSSVYAQFAHDAIKHTMFALHREQLSSGSLNPSNATRLLELIRSYRSIGLSGIVTLNNKGDRVHSEMKILNVQPGKQEVNVGVWRTSGIVLSHRVYWLNDHYDNPPTYSKGKVGSGQVDNTGSIVGAVVGSVGFLSILVLTAVIYFGLTKPTRDVANAPKDPTQPFALAFTDIQSSTALWVRAPQEMAAGVALHHKLIRRECARFNGYEVKTIGDSFMVAFAKPVDAIAFAVATQMALQNADWGTTIFDEIYAELESEHEETQNLLYQQSGAGKNKQNINNGKMWHGIRVRIGIHFGHGEIKYDDVALGYDYYGTVVNTAARIESVGHGGQILISESAYRSAVEVSKVRGLPPVDGETIHQMNLGSQMLRGLDLSVSIYQILPASLAERKFGPLRLEVEAPSIEPDEQAPIPKHPLKHDDLDSQRNPMEIMAFRESRRAQVGQGQVYDQYLSSYCFLKALLSTCKSKFRTNVVETIGKHWNVPRTAIICPDSASVNEQYLMAVVIKATPAADVHYRKMIGGGSSSRASSSVANTPRNHDLQIQERNQVLVNPLA